MYRGKSKSRTGFSHREVGLPPACLGGLISGPSNLGMAFGLALPLHT